MAPMSAARSESICAAFQLIWRFGGIFLLMFLFRFRLALLRPFPFRHFRVFGFAHLERLRSVYNCNIAWRAMQGETVNECRGKHRDPS